MRRPHATAAATSKSRLSRPEVNPQQAEDGGVAGPARLPQRRGDERRAGESQEQDGEVAERGHHLGPGPPADLGPVFAIVASTPSSSWELPLKSESSPRFVHSGSGPPDRQLAKSPQGGRWRDNRLLAPSPQERYFRFHHFGEVAGQTSLRQRPAWLVPAIRRRLSWPLTEVPGLVGFRCRWVEPQEQDLSGCLVPRIRVGDEP